MGNLQTNDGVNPTFGAAIFNKGAQMSAERTAKVQARASENIAATQGATQRSIAQTQSDTQRDTNASNRGIVTEQNQSNQLITGMQLEAQKEMEAGRIRANRLDADLNRKLKDKELTLNSAAEKKRQAWVESIDSRNFDYQKTALAERNLALKDQNAFERQKYNQSMVITLTMLRTQMAKLKDSGNMVEYQQMETKVQEAFKTFQAQSKRVDTLDKIIKSQLAPELADRMFKDAEDKYIDASSDDTYDVKTFKKDMGELESELSTMLEKATSGRIKNLSIPTDPQLRENLTQQDIALYVRMNNMLATELSNADRAFGTPGGVAKIEHFSDRYDAIDLRNYELYNAAATSEQLKKYLVDATNAEEQAKAQHKALQVGLEDYVVNGKQSTGDNGLEMLDKYLDYFKAQTMPIDELLQQDN